MTETLGHREAFDFHYRLGEGRSHKLGYSSPYRIFHGFSRYSLLAPVVELSGAAVRVAGEVLGGLQRAVVP